MSAKRILTLVYKDFVYGSRSTIFVFAIVLPLVASLILSVFLGNLLGSKARLGIVTMGVSALPDRLAEIEALSVRIYSNADALKQDVEQGIVDMGLILPPDFDQVLIQRGKATLEVYLWGSSLLKHRATLGAALMRQTLALAGREVPVEIVTTLLGDSSAASWGERLFPLVIMMALLVSGIMVPATSLVQEKQGRTLQAINSTPATLDEILMAKGLAGALITSAMGVIILLINRVLGTQPALLIGLILLGSLMASEIGVILGMVTGDLNSLFTIIKGLGILLYAPALVNLIPSLPAWTARLFPTYYLMGPVVEVSLHGASWHAITPDVLILLGLIIVGGLAVRFTARRVTL